MRPACKTHRADHGPKRRGGRGHVASAVSGQCREAATHRQGAIGILRALIRRVATLIQRDDLGGLHGDGCERFRLMRVCGGSARKANKNEQHEDPPQHGERVGQKPCGPESRCQQTGFLSSRC